MWEGVTGAGSPDARMRGTACQDNSEPGGLDYMQVDGINVLV